MSQLYRESEMLVFLVKHEFDWQIPSQIIVFNENMKTSYGSCGHFAHGGLWFDPTKRVISAKNDFLIK